MHACALLVNGERNTKTQQQQIEETISTLVQWKLQPSVKYHVSGNYTFRWNVDVDGRFPEKLRNGDLIDWKRTEFQLAISRRKFILHTSGHKFLARKSDQALIGWQKCLPGCGFLPPPSRQLRASAMHLNYGQNELDERENVQTIHWKWKCHEMKTWPL